MPDKTWKKRERQAAGLLGVNRAPLSGGNGRQTRSDSLHPSIFLETKMRAKCTARTLWNETKALAKAEGKIPVLALYEKGKHGALIVVHQDDLRAVAMEMVMGEGLPGD